MSGRPHDRVLYCRDVFELFSEAFARMERETGTQLETFDFAVAGHRVRAHVFGAALSDILRTAFDPWTGDGEPALEIRLWDESEDTGIDPKIRLECGLEETALRASIVTGVSESGRYVCNMADTWLNFIDLEQARIVGCVFSRAGFHIHERARPLELPMRFWLRSVGRPVLHAALVAFEGTGVLIGGPAGSGKSTTTLACVEQGLEYLGDDKIGLETIDPKNYVGHRLYRSILASTDMLEHFEHLQLYARSEGGADVSKAILMASELYPDQMRESCPIGAIVLPRLADLDAPRLRPARRSDAVKRMLPNCLPLYPTWDQTDFNRLAGLIQAVPVFHLELGNKLERVPQLVKQAVRGAV